MSLEINLAYTELDRVKELFNEYTATLNIDLDFQNYDDELANLPGKYILPQGRLYIGSYGGALAGCVALRPLNEKCCEMKRLYVRPQFRGLKIGHALAERIIFDAKQMQYDNIVLDTLPSFKEAIALYKKLGFYEIEPYYHNPIDNVLFLQLSIRGK